MVNELATVSQAAIVKQDSLETLIQAFLDSQDIKPASKATYFRSLKQFTAWLQDTGRAGHMDTLNRLDILAYRDSLLEAGKSAYTIQAYLASVRQLYAWLETEKVYPDITRGIKPGKKPRGFRKDILSEDSLRLVLASIDTDSLEGKRDYAIVNLLARTGLRTVEVQRAAIGDLRQEPGLEASERVLWIQGKGRDSKDDYVLLTAAAVQPITDYLRARGKTQDTEPLFCSCSDRNAGQALTTRSLSRIVKQALRAAGLDSDRLTAHSMRHTAISLAVAGGASLQQVQAMARHTDPKTTMTYFHNLNRIQNGAERYIHL